jgi:hypothetical protein
MSAFVMRVFLATRGEYSDYHVEHVFLERKDADAYPCADRVEEFEVREGPVETRTWHSLTWYSQSPDEPETTHEPPYKFANPHEHSGPRDWDGRDGYVTHSWERHDGNDHFALHIHGWDLQRVRKVYSEQRAQHVALH